MTPLIAPLASLNYTRVEGQRAAWYAVIGTAAMAEGEVAMRSPRHALTGHPHGWASIWLLGALVTTLALAACDSSSSVGGATPTSTAGATATATPLPAQNLAWIQYPPSGKPEVWASIAGAAPRPIAQASGDDCSTSTLGPPVFSPDAQHIAVAGGAGCGDGQEHGSAFIVTVSSGAFTAVPNSDALTNERSVGWIDNSTLWLASSGISTYTLGAGSPTELPGISSALPGFSSASEAVVRGTTMFYLAVIYDPSHNSAAAAIHRYSLTSHSDLGSPISLGSFDTPTDRSPGDFRFEGWDASPDGTHVVYQLTTAAAATDTNPAGIGSSRVYYASADGSGASQILQYLRTNSMVTMRVSPDGTQVAVSGAEPLPDIISGCVASPGTHGDPCFHSYTLPGGVASSYYPAWSADSHSFIVTGGGSSPSGTALYRVTVGTPSGTLFLSSGMKPWVV